MAKEDEIKVLSDIVKDCIYIIASIYGVLNNLMLTRQISVEMQRDIKEAIIKVQKKIGLLK